jgi:hypothetical protein
LPVCWCNAKPENQDKQAVDALGKIDLFNTILAMLIDILALDGVFDTGLATVQDTLKITAGGDAAARPANRGRDGGRGACAF